MLNVIRHVHAFYIFFSNNLKHQRQILQNIVLININQKYQICTYDVLALNSRTLPTTRNKFYITKKCVSVAYGTVCTYLDIFFIFAVR